MELKYTDKKSYSLKVADLQTAEKHALLDGRDMAFGISFSGEDYVVVTGEYYGRLHDALHTQQPEAST